MHADMQHIQHSVSKKIRQLFVVKRKE